MSTVHSDITWIRPRLCDSNACVEVAFLDDGVLVQSSEGGSAVFFTYDEWSGFIGGVKRGEFDGPDAAVNGQVVTLDG